MANTPPMNNLPFQFGSGGYTKPDMDKLAFDFSQLGSVVATSYLGASINVMSQPPAEYDTVKECPTYIIGYSKYGVQIIRGRCVYEGARNLTASVGIDQEIISSYKDLSATLEGLTWSDFIASIRGFACKDLTASIQAHFPADLSAFINVFSKSDTDLSAYLMGWQAVDFGATISALMVYDLQASLNPIQGVDLPAYLKVWPQRILPAYLRGWASKDLGADIKSVYYSNLNASISAHEWVNLLATVKGWGRTVSKDLQAYIRAFNYSDLSGHLRATYLYNLSASVFAIPFVPLTANIHSWDTLFLSASLNALDYPYNLRASLNAVDYRSFLSAAIKGCYATKVPFNLSASMGAWQQTDLSANMTPITAGILSASINPTIYVSVLTASIYPKMIRMTTVLAVSTMEHKDLAAMINVSCGSSGYGELTAYIRSVYKDDLSAYINGVFGHRLIRNLAATVGYSPVVTVVMDKFPIRVTSTGGVVKVVDILPIYVSMFKRLSYLTASIQGILHSTSLSSSLTPVRIEDYNFKYTKNKELVYNINRYGQALLSKIVEITFKSMVKDYIYLSSGNVVFSADDLLDRWVVDVKAYIPEDRALSIKRKLFRARVLHDLTRYVDIDEAVRLVVDYVTDEPVGNLSASINLTRGSMSTMLSAYVNLIYEKPGSSGLSSSINVQSKQLVVGVGQGKGIDII